MTRRWFLLHCCGALNLFGGGLLFVCLVAAGVAQGQNVERQESVGEGKELVSQHGFVFVDGKYFPPPYVVKESEAGVEINGRSVHLAAVSGAQSEARQAALSGEAREGERRRGWKTSMPRSPRHPTERPEYAPANYVVNQLNLDAVVIARAGEEASILFHRTQVEQFLRQVLETEVNNDRHQYVSYSSSAASNRLGSPKFSPSPSLIARAKKVIAEIDAVAAPGLAAERGLRRLSMFAFPLTIAGMILSFLASGHLVSYPPRPMEPEASASARLLDQRATVICLALLIGLSGLDLAWTLLASQAGQMIELNPLGSRMVDDPYSLVAFKISLTLASCGILFAFRRRHSARLASWWLCLALTLLTFRWLVFNSMQAA